MGGAWAGGGGSEVAGALLSRATGSGRDPPGPGTPGPRHGPARQKLPSRWRTMGTTRVSTVSSACRGPARPGPARPGPHRVTWAAVTGQTRRPIPSTAAAGDGRDRLARPARKPTRPALQKSTRNGPPTGRVAARAKTGARPRRAAVHLPTTHPPPLSLPPPSSLPLAPHPPPPPAPLQSPFTAHSADLPHRPPPLAFPPAQPAHGARPPAGGPALARPPLPAPAPRACEMSERKCRAALTFLCVSAAWPCIVCPPPPPPNTHTCPVAHVPPTSRHDFA